VTPGRPARGGPVRHDAGVAIFARVQRTGPGPRLTRWAVLAVALLAAGPLSACGTSAPAPAVTGSGSPATTAASAPASPRRPAPAVTSAPPTVPAPPTPLPVAPGAGSRPQTQAFPSATSAAFRNAMQDVWLAVTTGNPRLALPAFFPRAAYVQLKAIYDPGGDWDNRLWYDFTLDVAAAHRLVTGHDHLVRVLVASDDADWVPPNVCDNSIGYWHVSGARVVYTQHGQERSFGIASLIAWRGVWYVVHFGEVLRPVVTGIVDDPQIGPGVPGPAGGC
jgi:hypothetical protein